MLVSDHAELRVGERVGRRARRNSQQVCQELWQCGRTATPTDFERFDMRRESWCDYRVAIRERVLWMVVVDRYRQVFVTLVKLR